jgi:hypothetical protein
MGWATHTNGWNSCGRQGGTVSVCIVSRFRPAIILQGELKPIKLKGARPPSTEVELAPPTEDGSEYQAVGRRNHNDNLTSTGQ